LANRNLKSWRPKRIPETSLKKQLKMNAIPAPIEMLMEIYTGEYEGFELNDTTKLSYSKVAASQLYKAYTEWSNTKGFKNKLDERMLKIKIEKIAPIKYIKVCKGYQYKQG